MAIRMSGIASGMDTDSIVEALMATQKQKKVKIEGAKTKLEWKQEIWSGLNTKTYDFFNNSVRKMRLQGSFKTKKATSSDTSKLTVSAGTGAASSSYSIKVKQLAASQYVTGAKLGEYETTDADGNTVNSKVTKNTKLSDLGVTSDGSTQMKLTTGGKTTTLNIDEYTTVDDFVNLLKSNGLNASFDEGQGRFFIGAAESGKDNGFTLTSASLSGSQQAAQTELKNAMSYSSLSSADKSSVLSVFSSLQNGSGDDVKTKAKESLKEIADATAEAKVTAHFQEEKTKELTAKYLGDDGKTITEEGKKYLEDNGKWNDVDTEEDRIKMLTAQVEKETSEYMKADDTKALINSSVTNGLTADDGTVIAESTDVRNAKIDAAVENYANAIAAGTTQESDDASVLGKLGLGNIDGSAVSEKSQGVGMVVIAAQDALAEVNGATLNSATNTITANGLTMNLTGVSGDEEIKVTVSNDTDAVYDSIKEFVDGYNSLITDLNKYYYASSAKNYSVLTDDQKEAMSDDEVEKWNTKIKDSLLRRDSTLGSLLNSMRSAMTGTTITASNGKSYSLGNLGIGTGSDYKEYGLLHIHGDEDDSEYADDTNKIKQMLEEDPDTLCEVFSGIATKLYETLTDKMKSTTLSSALTFYNDKQMTKQLTTYKKEISTWESKLSDMENRYYSQFSAMETAMSKLNSQQSYFS